MNKKITISIIIILVGTLFYFLGNSWLNNRLELERNITILQIQNEIYKTVKTNGFIELNAFGTDGNEKIEIIDNIILVEDE